MSKMEHKIRVQVIGACWIAALASLVVMSVNGISEGTGFGVVAGVLGTLTPALVDATRVMRKNGFSIPPPKTR